MLEVARLFFKLGFLGFGGPIAAMAMMESEAVQKRQWLTQTQFTRAYTFIKILPGPVATMLAIYLGRLRAGRLGGLVAGVLFILPAFVLVLAISFFYQKYQQVPTASALFQGMQIAALVVIGDSVIRLAKPHSQSVRSIAIAFVSALVVFVRPSFEPLVIFLFGMLGAFQGKALAAFFALPALSMNSVVGGNEKTLMQLAWVCFKAGAFVFGSGLSIVPLLEADVVGHYHWLNHGEFLDGLAIGQVTPGPVVITATFIGYKVAGFLGAALATLAIFLPAFIIMLLILPWAERRAQLSSVGTARMELFSQWAIPAVIGGIVASLIKLGFTSITSHSPLILLLVCILALWRWRPPVWVIIPFTGVVYFLLQKL